MFTTGPRPPDIPFDHAAAAVAVGALERADAVLADVGDARRGASATARQHFAGAHADDFTRTDDDLGVAADDARAAAQALRQAIAAASDAARAAQATRALEQQGWDLARPHRPTTRAR